MKKITYICDKCFREVAHRIYCIQEAHERHLQTIGAQEWCDDCLEQTFGREILCWQHKAKAVEVNDYKELKRFYL